MPVDFTGTQRGMTEAQRLQGTLSQLGGSVLHDAIASVPVKRSQRAA